MSRSIDKNKNNDENQRYKMPELKFRYIGTGNGCSTSLDNIKDIGDSLNTPPSILLKYISVVCGCRSTKEYIITGHQIKNDIDEAIYSYIKNFIICPRCKLPELKPSVIGKKKKKKINISCSACAYNGILESGDKHFDKGKKFLINHIEKNGWEIKKGMMVEQTQKSNEYDPFS